MKYAVQILTIISALIGCSRMGESQNTNQKATFSPTTDVYLELIIDDVKWSNSEIKIFKHNKGGELIYSLKTGTNRSQMIRIEDIVYLSIIDREIDDGNLSLMQIELAKGLVRKTPIRLSGDFKFTSDGRWICYAFNDHEIKDSAGNGIGIFFPIIFLERVGSTEKYKYDKLSEMPVNAAEAMIEGENSFFKISYFQDSPVPIRVGKISIATHEFTWIK